MTGFRRRKEERRKKAKEKREEQVRPKDVLKEPASQGRDWSEKESE